MKRVKKRRGQFGSGVEGKKSLAQSIILAGTIDFRTRKTSAAKSTVMILRNDELQCRGFTGAEEIQAVTTVHTPCRLSNCGCFFSSLFLSKTVQNPQKNKFFMCVQVLPVPLPSRSNNLCSNPFVFTPSSSTPVVSAFITVQCSKVSIRFRSTVR